MSSRARLPRWLSLPSLAIVAVGCTSDTADGEESGPDCVTIADGRCVDETFANPPVLAPDGSGVHTVALAATEVVLDGKRHCVRAYNGSAVGPTIETPARTDAPRSVRVDLLNRLRGHDYQSLEGGACTCTTASGDSCVPGHAHDACATGGHDHDPCVCVDDEGEACEHMFDFNVTNLHAHGSHVRPDFARGGEACAEATVDGVTLRCRDCDNLACDGTTTDDTCFNADNVLNAVAPGDGARYRWDIDEDGTHHEGLQWYHPHIHGTTAMQVASGAAGAWIVRGPVDSLPGVAAARERVMVLSTPPLGSSGFAPLAEGEACTADTITFNDFSVLGSVSALQTNVINGVRRPRLITPPGQVERWRLLHAGFLDEVFLGVFRGADADCGAFSTAEADTLRLVQIARDGLTMPQAHTDRYVFMSPGYRVDTLVDGANLSDGDTWCLVAARFLQDGDRASLGDFGLLPMAPPTPPTPEQLFARFAADGDVIAVLNVSADAGAPTETSMPDLAAIAALAPSLEVDGVPAATLCAQAAARSDANDIDQVAVLQVGIGTVDDPDPCGCEAYNVNCANFESTDRERYPFDRDLRLNAVEHWRVAASLDGHPFHIHINPYVFCSDATIFDPMPFPHWRDTVLVNAGRRVDLITQNRAFTGPYVFHCHKLTHEDHGMMEVVRVCDPAEDATCGSYDWRACDADDLVCAQQLAATDCYVNSPNPAAAVACVLGLGSPAGVCGPAQCAADADCAAGTCVDHVCTVASTCTADDDCDVAARCSEGACVPAPCALPCGPGSQCVHGVCTP